METDPRGVRSVMADSRRHPVTDDELQTNRRCAHEARSLDDVFGDVLPDCTEDEHGSSWGETARGRDADLRRDVPPHHE